MKSLKTMAAIILGLIVGILAPALVAGYQKKLPDSYGNERQLLRLVSVEDFPVYKPRRPSPPHLAPRGRVGSGVRGGGGEGSPILPLAPDHVGFTIEEQPSLYWFLSQETSSAIEFTLRDDRSISPIIETRLPSPAQPGVHRISLKDLGIKLEIEVQYKWYVTLLQGPEASSKDIVAGGTIERMSYIDWLSLCQGKGDTVNRFAECGIWYNAIAAISEQIEASPNDFRLRCTRASLLKQVKLSEIAKYDCKE
jgi:hypothetical protein